MNFHSISPPTLSTDRLRLRQLRMDDDAEIFVLRSDPRILAFIAIQKADSLDDARAFIQKITDSTTTYWGITLRDPDKLIGTICLWNIVPEEARAEVGYVLHPDFQGKGYMQEALLAVIEYGFAKMQLLHIDAYLHPANAKSVNLLVRNHFAYTGESEGMAVYTRSKHVAPDTVRRLALALAETDEAPHHEARAFRVKKKIFATLNAAHNRACLKFTDVDQDVFCAFADSPFYAVPNKWGKQGWTLVDLQKVDEAMMKDALTVAYCTVAPKKLAGLYLPEGE